MPSKKLVVAPKAIVVDPMVIASLTRSTFATELSSISLVPTASLAISSESTEFAAKDKESVTSAVPSNETAGAVASPLALKLRAVSIAVADEAFPLNAPVKLAEETLVKPVTVVVIVPSDISVLPRTKPSLVKSSLSTLPFAISAEPTAPVAISSESTAPVAISSEATEFASKDNTRSTFPVPSNETAWAVASPLALKLRAFCKAVAVPAFPETLPVTLPETLPLRSPVKLVEETLAKPVTVVVVVPSDISVLPRTKPSLVKSTLATLPFTISAEATELSERETARSTFAVPLNDTAAAVVASPLTLKSRAVSIAVADEAFPLNAPVKLVEETLAKPVTVVVVVPSDISVLPRTKPSLVKSTLATLPFTISAEATELSAIESTRSTFPVPSNETAGAVASPLALKLRAVSSAVAVEAFPVKSAVIPLVTVSVSPVASVNSNSLASNSPAWMSPAMMSSACKSSIDASSASRSEAKTSWAPMKLAVRASISKSVSPSSTEATSASRVNSSPVRFQ